MREDGHSDQSGSSRCSKWLDSIHISKVRLTGFAFLMMALGPHCKVLTSQLVYNSLVGRAHFFMFLQGFPTLSPVNSRYSVWSILDHSIQRNNSVQGPTDALQILISEHLPFESMINYVTKHFLGQFPIFIPCQKSYSSSVFFFLL